MLSATKLSLANIRTLSNRQRKRRPPSDSNHNNEEGRSLEAIHDKESETDQEKDSDDRAIKKSTRLVLEGCNTKAAKILDQTFQKNELSDQENIEKLGELHPQRPSELRVPSDAP